MIQPKRVKKKVSPEEYLLLQRLRERKPGLNPPQQRPTMGDRAADMIAAGMGSWRFIVIQSVLLLVWVLLNATGHLKHWDPYPFILLNLLLSFQAAYAAPIIMMSQNRQATIDRKDAKNDYEVNQKVELEIALMQDKINQFRGEEIVELRNLLIDQRQQLNRMSALLLDRPTPAP
jgi:uncharacterized membrane protein